jgi:myo-inositol-1(or 4)-monophosphatase
MVGSSVGVSEEIPRPLHLRVQYYQPRHDQENAARVALMEEFIKTCEQAARAGGAVLLDWQDRITAREKGPRDLVTEADVASQNMIREIVLGAFPDHDFLGEEDLAAETPAGKSSGRAANSARYRWIVDPLDGTTNYVHGLPAYAVSVALQRDGELLAGAVFDPILDECYTASAGGGAFLNGRPLKASPCSKLSDAMAVASFSANVPRGSIEITRFIEVLHSCQALRRLGSAALNLCYVASGRLDAYWATSVKIWDVAAGVLLVREAGGIVSDISGNPLNLADPTLVATATPELQSELLSVLARAGT